MQDNQVSQKITQELLTEITEGRFKKATALPPEIQLAEEFGVSRNAVREALTRLEREGWIARKHGVGTLINHHVISAGARLDLNYEFKRTLEISGHEAKIINHNNSVIPADKNIADRLGITEGEKLLKSSRLFLADDKPAIFCVDYCPLMLLPEKKEETSQAKESFFLYLKDECGIEVESSLAEIRARAIGPEAAEALGLDAETVLLTMEEVSYDLHAKRVLYSESFFVDQMIHHTIVRKKI